MLDICENAFETEDIIQKISSSPKQNPVKKLLYGQMRESREDKIEQVIKIRMIAVLFKYDKVFGARAFIQFLSDIL